LPSFGNTGEDSGAPPLSPSAGDRAGNAHGAPYIPDTADDYELGSEVVRHAEPVDEPRASAANYSREAESTYASLIKGAGVPPEEPSPIDTVASSVNITYDAQDLEIPAFLRKRGEN
jgi:hypothetical protein